MTAIAMVAQHPHLVKSLFPPIPRYDEHGVRGEVSIAQERCERGAYAVRFWKDGRWRIVIVDDFIPCNSYGNPAFAQLHATAAGVSVFWPLIVEKAYAKLHGSYAAVRSGSVSAALVDLTGGMAFDVGSSRNLLTIDAPWTGEVSRGCRGAYACCLCNAWGPRSLAPTPTRSLAPCVHVGAR